MHIISAEGTAALLVANYDDGETLSYIGPS
jgi:hypothetical protein